ncbi:hypothetical protein MLD38_024834 [Melastoma candidum]|uniref:Uncharacterized protein n=1 Tax=Melastoma candidum TaxID=119954 RepID=A0ACB9NUG5_9MYRT|nr:hypothetical protein MLD38_024834 [Melastoma candidum]
MDRYQRVEKPKAGVPIEANEIRITSLGRMRNYITYAMTLLQDKDSSEIVFKAMGRAINKTVTIVELIKRRIVGLHQVTSIGSTDITDTWEPLEEGLLPLETTRHVSMITITLSKKELDTSSVGYQPPLPADLVKPSMEYDNEGEGYPSGRRRVRGGRGRPRAEGNGYMNNEYADVWDNNQGYARGRGRGGGRGFRGRGEVTMDLKVMTIRKADIIKSHLRKAVVSVGEDGEVMMDLKVMTIKMADTIKSHPLKAVVSVGEAGEVLMDLKVMTIKMADTIKSHLHEAVVSVAEAGEVTKDLEVMTIKMADTIKSHLLKAVVSVAEAEEVIMELKVMTVKMADTIKSHLLSVGEAGELTMDLKVTTIKMVDTIRSHLLKAVASADKGGEVTMGRKGMTIKMVDTIKSRLLSFADMAVGGEPAEGVVDSDRTDRRLEGFMTFPVSH